MTISKISISKLRPFEEYFERFSKTKKKNLQSFIDIASKIHNGEITYSQHCKISKKTTNNLIGTKRGRSDMNNSNNDIVNMIDDFIYTKKKMLNENEFEGRFVKLKDILNEYNEEEIENLNTNAFNSIVKLMRFMTCSRNFSNDIIKKKKIFEELKDKMQNLIIDKLFNCSHIIESSTEKSNEFSIEEPMSSNELISLINTSITESELSISSSKDNTKVNQKENHSESDSSINISSGTKTDYEDLKTKIKIVPVDNIGVYNILRSFQVLECKDTLKANIESNIEVKSKIKSLMSSLVKSTSNKCNIKSPYLRKRVCCKLYCVFHILFNNINYVSDDDIKNLCVALEAKARDIDKEMSFQYKNYISNIFNKIKTYFLS